MVPPLKAPATIHFFFDSLELIFFAVMFFVVILAAGVIGGFFFCREGLYQAGFVVVQSQLLAADLFPVGMDVGYAPAMVARDGDAPFIFQCRFEIVVTFHFLPNRIDDIS